MIILLIIFAIILGLAAVIVNGVLYYIYRQVFYCSPKVRKDIYELPKGDQYVEQKDYMIGLIRNLAEVPYEWVSIQSDDGLELKGKYYHHVDNGPVEIMFHGYRGAAEREFCGQYWICKSMGHNALLVDQRGHGASQGLVTTFGIKERYDCLNWIKYVTERFGPETKIIICGLSMGAATVMMCSDMIPDNVVGIAEDCGYDSPEGIISAELKNRGMNPKLIYPVVRAAAIRFGHFDPNECSAIESLKKAKVPMQFIHGEEDRLVPCQMARTCYEACASKDKFLLTVPKAGHGISYVLDKQAYIDAMEAFGKVCFPDVDKISV